MKRFLVPSMLMLMTLIIVGRAGVAFLHPAAVTAAIAGGAASKGEQADGVAASLADSVNVAGEMAAEGADSVLAIGDQLIPSAEAAASMAIAEEASAAPEERELLDSLRATREKLAAMEKSLAEREKEAAAAEKKAAERIAELESLETRIQDLLAEEEKIKSKKIKRLTAVYEGMKADKAAPVIAEMDLMTVVLMFSRMDEKQVGKILSNLPPEKAVVISQELTKKISQVGP